MTRPYTPASLAEEWRPVPGFSFYEVSNRGAIRSLPRKGTRGGIISQKTNKGGYKTAVIFNGSLSSRVDVFVHHLVLLTFVGPRPPGAITAHLDDNPSNNAKDNLIWATQKENMALREAHGRTPRGFRHRETKFTESTLAEIRRLLPIKSQRAIATQFGVHPSTIWRVKVGITYR